MEPPPFSRENAKAGATPRGAPREVNVKVRADSNNGERLLTPAEVAALFRVDPKTVTRWAKAGKLSSIRTLGGHRRYWESEVRRLLERSAVV
jgi:excisionase family DNA binding protein